MYIFYSLYAYVLMYKKAAGYNKKCTVWFFYKFFDKKLFLIIKYSCFSLSNDVEIFAHFY